MTFGSLDRPRGSRTPRIPGENRRVLPLTYGPVTRYPCRDLHPVLICERDRFYCINYRGKQEGGAFKPPKKLSGHHHSTLRFLWHHYSNFKDHRDYLLALCTGPRLD